MKPKITIKPKKILAALVVMAAVIALFFLLPVINGALKESAQAAGSPAGWHGDVDNDGDVTAADARLALRAAVGLEDYAPQSLPFVRADYDKDGEITASDARMILRTAVALEPLIESVSMTPDEPDTTMPEETTLSPEEEQLRQEEEAKQRDKEQHPTPTDAEPAPEKPTYAGDGINTCLYCGKPCGSDEYGNRACALGGCSRSSFADWTCIHCGETVPVGICHTCTNPTFFYTELPKK